MTYYEILNVNKHASDKEIKIAYRALAKKYHPDTYNGDKNVAEEKMKQINEAYDVLSNKELKMKYDEQFNITNTYSSAKESYSQTTSTRNSYYSNAYKAPDPPDADYRSYYNYSPYYEENEPDYDFSKLKELFKGTRLKVIFSIIGVFSILIFFGAMLNRLKLETTALLESMSTSSQTYTPKEIVPENNYMPEVENNIEVPDTKAHFEIDTESFEKELEQQLKELEIQYNEWYESEGKEYAEQFRQELNLLYEEMKNQVNINY